MFDNETDEGRTARMLIEARASEIAGHPVRMDSVQDILWMISEAVGYARKYRQAPQFGPEHEMTLAFRDLAERLQSGL